MTFISETEIENQRLPIFIDGEFRLPHSGHYLPSVDPSTGSVWHEVADCCEQDVNDAVTSAWRALKPGNTWSCLTASDRGDLLYRLADLIGHHALALADIETRDNGKLIKETQTQIRYLARYYRYFAGLADKIQGAVIPVNRHQMLNYTVREPLGVVGLIVPWNSPLNTMSVTAAACLAAGNALIVKPSEHTSASTLAFAHLILQAGFPKGVFNVVTGRGAGVGDALTRHTGIAKIAFTGGTETGIKVATNAASHIAPCVLELGGKSPHVIFADADLDRAVNGVMSGIFAAAGQTCVAGSRCFIEQSIYDEVLALLVERTQSIRIGHPKAATTQMGPLATKQQYQKVANYSRYGVEDGARLMAGGHTVQPIGYENGFFFAPTIFADVDKTMRIAQEEIFGPLVGVQAFSNEADLIVQANDTRYGLTAGVWTRDIDRAMRFARNIEAGTIWINTYRTASFTTPMGGFKDSGYGKHNGIDGLSEWTRSKTVMIDYSGETQDAFVIRIK